MANTLPFSPDVSAHRQATSHSNTIVLRSKLQLAPFGTHRQRRPRLARGASLAVSAGKKVLMPVANGSEEMEAVMYPTAHHLSGFDLSVREGPLA